MKVILLVFVSLMVLWSGRFVSGLPSTWQIPGLGGTVLILLGWVLFLRHEGWGGLDGNPWDWQLKWLPLGIASGLVLFLLSAVGYLLSERVLNLSPPAETALIGNSIDLRFGLLLTAALGAAVLEEWLFRGLLISRIRALPTWSVILGSALAFAVYHLSLFQLLPTFLLGVGLAVIFTTTASLWPTVIAHVVFNAAGLLLTTFRIGVQQAG